MGSIKWSPLGSVDPRELVDTRLAVHYAAQPLAAVAQALLPMQRDYSHTNLLWSAGQKRFVGRPLRGGSRAFLDVAAFRPAPWASGSRPATAVSPSPTST